MWLYKYVVALSVDYLILWFHTWYLPGLQKLKQEELKLEKLYQSFASDALLPLVAINDISDLDKKEKIHKLLDGGVADVLASHLDDLKKAEVTDLAIFRAHAAKLVLISIFQFLWFYMHVLQTVNAF